MSIFILKTAFLYFIFNLLHKTGVQHLLQLFSSGFFFYFSGEGLASLLPSQVSNYN